MNGLYAVTVELVIRSANRLAKSEWTTSRSLPTFYVQACSEENARAIAMAVAYEPLGDFTAPGVSAHAHITAVAL